MVSEGFNGKDNSQLALFVLRIWWCFVFVFFLIPKLLALAGG